jgi:hypothetical protein
MSGTGPSSGPPALNGGAGAGVGRACGGCAGLGGAGDVEGGRVVVLLEVVVPPVRLPVVVSWAPTLTETRAHAGTTTTKKRKAALRAMARG